MDSDLYRRASNTRCTSKADCGAGFACIDGQCTRIHTRNGGNWTPNSCGDDSITWVCTKGDKSGSNDTCTKPTPGNCDKDPICPGERCCRQQADGSIRCVCGSCEQTDTSTCNVYCDQQYKAFGVVRPGCYTRDMEGFGECGGNICDECKFCEDTFLGYAECVLGEQDDPFNPLPCHCFPKCAEECHICNKDTDSPNFGDCEYSPDNCQQCCTLYNYECPNCPNTYIPEGSHCEPVGSTKPCITALREKLAAQCAQKQCQDPCAPTGSFSRCVDGSAPVDPIANPGGPSGQSCPEGKTCQYTGYIEAGGKTCYLYSTWVTADIPPECKESDCNCHDDCPDCQLCGSDGKCYNDPVCDICGEGQRVCQDLETCCPEESACVPIYNNIFQDDADGSTINYPSVGAPANFYFTPANGESPDCNNVSPTRDTMTLTNAYTGGLACDNPNGEELTVAIADPQCYGPGTSRPDITPFVPVLISSEIASIWCC